MPTIALLPLHHGSVLVPMTGELSLVTKHVDGELIRIVGEDNYAVDRRQAEDISFWDGGGYTSRSVGVATLADRQAFGFRQDGLATNFTNANPDADTVEIEPLDRGAILLQDESQLPIGFYLDESGKTFRLRHGIQTLQDEPGENHEVAILEVRKNNHSDWNQLYASYSYDLRGIGETLAEHSPIEYTNTPTAEKIESIIDENFESAYEVPFSGKEQKTAETMRMQLKTAIQPNFPAPKPLLES